MSRPDRGPLARLLALAWDYRAVCLRVFVGQLASLALGLGALAGSGLAVDVVRRALEPTAPPARVFDKLLRLGGDFFQRNASGSIINRVTSDVQSLRAFVDGVVLQGA